jgi:hypothetical protein
MQRLEVGIAGDAEHHGLAIEHEAHLPDFQCLSMIQG